MCHCMKYLAYIILQNYTILTNCGESQLPADHLGIGSAPEVIAHCAPDIVVADLHASLCPVGPSLQADVSIVAHCVSQRNQFTQCTKQGGSNSPGGGKHLTPASSAWTQSCCPSAFRRQLKSLVSVPAHCTLSSMMEPIPCPKKALVKALAPGDENEEGYGTLY